MTLDKGKFKSNLETYMEVIIYLLQIYREQKLVTCDKYEKWSRLTFNLINIMNNWTVLNSAIIAK